MKNTLLLLITLFTFSLNAQNSAIELSDSNGSVKIASTGIEVEGFLNESKISIVPNDALLVRNGNDMLIVGSTQFIFHSEEDEYNNTKRAALLMNPSMEYGSNLTYYTPSKPGALVTDMQVSIKEATTGTVNHQDHSPTLILGDELKVVLKRNPTTNLVELKLSSLSNQSTIDVSKFNIIPITNHLLNSELVVQSDVNDSSLTEESFLIRFWNTKKFITEMWQVSFWVSSGGSRADLWAEQKTAVAPDA